MERKNTFILRPDCKIKRILPTCFQVYINKYEEFIKLDEERADLLDLILPLLNGKYTCDEITSHLLEIEKVRLPKQILRRKVKNIIERLFKWGLVAKIEDLTDFSNLSQTRFFSCFTSNPKKMEKKLEKICVGIIGGKYVTPLVLKILCQGGVKHFRLFGTHTIDDEELIFYNLTIKEENRMKVLHEEISVLSNRKAKVEHFDEITAESLENLDLALFLLPSIKSINKGAFMQAHQLCLQKNIKILYGELRFSTSIIGPFVIPFESACLGCLESRYRELPENNFSWLASTSFSNETLQNRNFSNLISFTVAHASLVAGYAILHLLGISDLLINRILVFDFLSGIIHRYFILKSPRCPLCGRKKL